MKSQVAWAIVRKEAGILLDEHEEIRMEIFVDEDKAIEEFNCLSPTYLGGKCKVIKVKIEEVRSRDM